jgi:PAS domain S-box-containing protein
MDFVAQIREFREVFVLTDVGGRIVISNESSNEGDYRVNDSFFTNGRHKNYLTNVYPSPVSGQPTLTFSTPIKDPDGQRLGVAAAHLHLNQMDEVILERAGLGDTGETYLVDKFNVFVSARRFGRVDFPRGVHSPGIDTAVQGKNGHGLYQNYAGVPVVGVYRWLEEQQLALLAEVSEREAFAPARRLGWSIFFTGLIVSLLLAFGVFLLARQIARPVLAVTDASARVTSGDFSFRAPVLTDDEVGDLARSFNQMTDRLQDLYQALKRSEEHFRTVFELSPDGITVTRKCDGTFVTVNQSFAEITGYSQEELLGRSVVDTGLWESLAEKDPFRDVANADSQTATEVKFRCKDGNQRFGMLSTQVITLDGEAYLVSILHDITVRRQAEVGLRNHARELQQRLVEIKLAEEEKLTLQDQLQEVQKMEAIGTLAGGIAHDFNNILSAVIGYTELALMDLPKNTPAYHHLFQVIKAGRRAKELVQQILTFSRQSEQDLKPVQVKLIVKEALKLLRASLPATIEIKRDLRSESTVLADPIRMHQVVINLCTNAAHALRPKGGLVEVKLSDVEVDADYSTNHPELTPGRYVKLTVSDTGHGMTPQIQERIFDPFFTTKEKGEGTGMGLSVVHGIVKSSGGSITVHSESGKGTSFNVFLPIIEMQAEVQRWQNEAIPTGTERILFVDDEETLVVLNQQLLATLGYAVTARTNPLEALEFFRSQPDNFDLVITDMTMPKMTGEELARELIKIRPDIPIILCTGFSATIDENRAEQIGLRACVYKPILQRDIAATIRKVLDNS